MLDLVREVAMLRHSSSIARRWPRRVWIDDGADYYRTALWLDRRALSLERDKNQCQFCNSSLLLRIHHRTYERFGCELPEDLITVCSVCHKRLHGITEETTR